MKLHSRIYLHSLAVLVVVVIAVTAVFALRLGTPPAHDVAERIGRHVATLVAEAATDPERLRRRVDQIHRDIGLSVAVHAVDGRSLASAGVRPPAPTAGDIARAHAGEIVTGHRPMPYAVAPFTDGSSRIAGTVTVAIPRRFGSGTLLGPLALVGLVLLVLAVATRPLARRLARPIERLTDAARRLAAGDLAARAGHVVDGARRPHAPDEIRELTRTFDDMAERVERLVRGQRELLANVSHELRSPLARIRVALELLPRTSGVEPRITDIERDLAELERLVEDVLATARLEATGLPATLATVDVPALLDSLVERARHDPATAGREVRVSASSVGSLVGDQPLIRRALWNLVENAAKYGAPPIELAASSHADFAALSVTDHGAGIAAEARTRVLEPFERLDRARTPGQATSGFGLGLTFARRVAEAHGGRITIAPATIEGGRDQGCRVTLTLPART